MGFKENLKAELEYQGIKIKDLAEKSGVKRRTIDHYLMTNPQAPSVTNAFKIAQALNVSVEYLMTGQDAEHGQQPQEIRDIVRDLSSLPPHKLSDVKKMVHALL